MNRKLNILKKVFFRLMTPILFLGILFGIGEIYLRCTTCLGSRPTLNPYLADATVGWRGRPNAEVCRSLQNSCAEYRYNRDGFRGPDRPYLKPAGTRRIVVLGDSFMEGYQFGDDELMTAKLEAMLNENGARNEVINIGISGWGTAQEYLAYRRFGRLYQPDIVILMMSTCNDIIDTTKQLSDIYKQRLNYLKPYVEVVDDQMIVHRPAKQLVRKMNLSPPFYAKEAPFSFWEMLDGFPRFLCRTRVGYYLWSRWNRPTKLRLLLDDWGLAPFADKLYSTTWGEHGYYHGLSLRFWIYCTNNDPLWRNALHRELTVIKHLNERVRANGSRFILVSGANIEQAYPDIWDLTLETQPQLKQMELNLSLPEERLRQVTEANHIEYISLLPFFQEQAKNGKELFLRGDGHWSADGQLLAAQVLARYLHEERSMFAEH